MNLFFVFGSGSDAEVVTPELTGSLLPGRHPRLAADAVPGSWATARPSAGSPPTSGRRRPRVGELTEVFACGTAAVITPVGSVQHAEGGFEIAGGQPGTVTLQLREELTALQYGRRPDTPRLDGHGRLTADAARPSPGAEARVPKRPPSRAGGGPFGVRWAGRTQPRTTLPALRHEVHTLSLRTVPGATCARTGWMFGFHRRWVRRCECDTLMPKPGPLPHTSHTAATPNTPVALPGHRHRGRFDDVWISSWARNESGQPSQGTDRSDAAKSAPRSAGRAVPQPLRCLVPLARVRPQIGGRRAGHHGPVTRFDADLVERWFGLLLAGCRRRCGPRGGSSSPAGTRRSRGGRRRSCWPRCTERARCARSTRRAGGTTGPSGREVPARLLRRYLRAVAVRCRGRAGRGSTSGRAARGRAGGCVDGGRGRAERRRRGVAGASRRVGADRGRAPCGCTSRRPPRRRGSPASGPRRRRSTARGGTWSRRVAVAAAAGGWRIGRPADPHERIEYRTRGLVCLVLLALQEVCARTGAGPTEPASCGAMPGENLGRPFAGGGDLPAGHRRRPTSRELVAAIRRAVDRDHHVAARRPGCGVTCTPSDRAR